eukprot:gene16418-20067_t
MAMPAMLPAALVGLHFAVQITRPHWGYGSDLGATHAALMMANAPELGVLLSVLAYLMIGMGVGASGTSLLALLATRVAPERRPAAASITWIMMIVGIVVSSIIVAQLITPFSARALIFAATAVAGCAFLVTLAAVHGVELPKGAVVTESEAAEEAPEPVPFRQALKDIWAEPLA